MNNYPIKFFRSTAERVAQIETTAMEFVPKAKGYSEREEAEEEEEIKSSSSANKLPFSSDPSSSPSAYKLWQGNCQSEYVASRSYMNKLPSLETAIDGHKKLQAVDLSLRLDNDIGGEIDGDRSYGHGNCSQREDMFDKVVTPSDVGKLNRLVIPKQHAEKYFPLDSSSNEKGLILNFEDRNGKSWRFRYSYWNSSQSYVMTKGWSRFVKEKKLDAGDVVSFKRGVGEVGKHRLFIDWRRRPDAPPHLAALAHLPQTVKWGSRQLIPPSTAAFLPHHYRHFQTPNYSSINPHYYQNGASEYFNGGNFESGSLYYLRPSSSYAIGGLQQSGEASPMVIDSVPVVHHGKSKPKRLRLFGVNLECPVSEEPIATPHFSSSSSSPQPPFLIEYPATGKASSSLQWNPH